MDFPSGRRVALIVCGANIDIATFAAQVSEAHNLL